MPPVKVELSPDSATWIKDELAAGHFATAEEAVRHAIEQAKLSALRETIEASIARGGSNTGEEVMAHVRNHLAAKPAAPKA